MIFSELAKNVIVHLSGVSSETLPPDPERYQDDERTCFIFTIDGTNYAAIEDPSDGYRSYCEELVITDKEPTNKFPPQRVLIRHRTGPSPEEAADYYEGYSREDDVMQIVNPITNETILELGTENTDDYYSCCVMRYYPEHLPINSTEKKSVEESKPEPKKRRRFLDTQ